jgi:hypothetical protein
LWFKAKSDCLYHRQDKKTVYTLNRARQGLFQTSNIFNLADDKYEEKTLAVIQYGKNRLFSAVDYLSLGHIAECLATFKPECKSDMFTTLYLVWTEFKQHIK